MPFLALPALLGLLFVPLVLAFYMLKLRRPERTVSSTYLWQALVRDVEANAPWQRLRRSLLLLIQLLLVVALALLAARPFTERSAGLARDVVVVLDASASMAATDVFPDRLSAAKRELVAALRDLPSDGRVSVVSAGETARVVANEVTDKGRATAAIEGIRQTNGSGSLADALKLADALAARARGAEVIVATDDAPRGDVAAQPSAAPGASASPAATLAAPVRVITVGQDRDNQAVVALAVQADPSGVKRSVFVSVANFADKRVTRRLQILADGTPVTARDLALDALRRTQVVIDELPPGTRVVEARLRPGEAAPQPTAGAPEAVADDQLALDDVAWAIVPEHRLQRILLVGPGNVYLQNALSLLPNVELYGATAEEYPATTGKERFDLIVFDGYLPPELPRKPILAIAPPATSALGVVSGTLQSPGIGSLSTDDALLRNVDLTRLHIARAQQMELPQWARTVIPGPKSSPLLYSGTREGLPTAVMAFDLRQSDLPLQVAWPILAANLVGELLDLVPATTDPVRPGAPLELALPPDTAGLRVTKPDGTVIEVQAGAVGAPSVTFVGTDQLGVYRTEWIPAAVAPFGSGSPGAATPTPTAAPSPSPSGSAGASEPPANDASALFAVDLFDTRESDIASGDGNRIRALGGTAAPPDPAATGTARDEWWVPLALLALLVLMIEWLVYERDGARRLFQRARAVSLPRRVAPRGRG